MNDRTVKFIRVQKEIKEDIAVCTACPTVQSPAVPYAGFLKPDRPKYLVIGEAPGPDEYALNTPFVGRAGKLLRGELKRLEVENVAYGNTIQCYPGTTRPPSLNERSRCKGHLVNIVSGLRPDVVLLTGNVALQTWWPDLKVTEVRGELWKGTPLDATKGVWFMATWHPSAVLRERQGSRKLREFREDLEKWKQTGIDIWLKRRFEEDEGEGKESEWKPRGPVLKRKNFSRRGIADDGQGNIFDAEAEENTTA